MVQTQKSYWNAKQLFWHYDWIRLCMIEVEKCFFAECELHKSQGIPGGERNKKFQNISKTWGLKKHASKWVNFLIDVALVTRLSLSLQKPWAQKKQQWLNRKKPLWEHPESNQNKMFGTQKTKPYNMWTEEDIDTTLLMSSIDPCVLDVSLSKLLKVTSFLWGSCKFNGAPVCECEHEQAFWMWHWAREWSQKTEKVL